MVLDKPAGLGMHNESEAGFITLLREQCDLPTLFPVHRLDKLTSGIIIVAKNKSATREFSTLFEARRVGKFYWAISDHKPIKKQGKVVGDMDKARGGSWKLLRSRHNPALTQFFSDSLGDGLRAYLLKPHSGKTHQLRVALKSLGAPILGDTRYGGTRAERMYLHASHIKFALDGQEYSYSSEPSDGAMFCSDAFKSSFSKYTPPEALAWPTISHRK